MYSKEEREWALYVLEECGDIIKAAAILDGPGRETLRRWAIEEGLDYRPKSKARVFLSYKEKLSAVRALMAGEKATSIAKRYGVTAPTICNWRRQLLEKGEISLMTQDDIAASCTPDPTPDETEELRRRCEELELKNAILEQTIEILKKDPGVDPMDLTNKEKVLVVDALRTRFALRNILNELGMPRASYYYHRHRKTLPDKYRYLRARIQDIFRTSKCTFGSERIWATLRLGLDGHDPLIVSEKVVRRLMKEERLRVIYNKKRRVYSSYKGEISEHPGNLIKRDFHANRPNMAWLTDITQFTLPDYKCYLSPVVDCFDGKVISHKLSLNPNAELVNTMLKDAAELLRANENPICHSDCGCHYRWPTYIELCKRYGITRSMSKKGCSPDNAACEGFFGRLKNEFFYHRNWKGVPFEEFKRRLDDYIEYYNESRPKKSLGWMSPNAYRRSIGMAV